MCDVNDITGTVLRHCKANNLTLLGDVQFVPSLSGLGKGQSRVTYAFRAEKADGTRVVVKMIELSDRWRYE